jgi:hypothetical protein
VKPEPSTPSPAPVRGALIVAIVFVLIGTGLFLTSMIAGLKVDGPAREAVIFGFPAWQVAVAGFLCTLAGGLWLQRLVK